MRTTTAVCDCCERTREKSPVRAPAGVIGGGCGNNQNPLRSRVCVRVPRDGPEHAIDGHDQMAHLPPSWRRMRGRQNCASRKIHARRRSGPRHTASASGSTAGASHRWRASRVTSRGAGHLHRVTRGLPVQPETLCSNFRDPCPILIHFLHLTLDGLRLDRMVVTSRNN